ncbi:hypothetical protein BKA62DRAFT_780050 [Auriculariales sp. MPI-PUGE-AT-0066]|nr:hypothetical protein BKA62DRAFT_780050 [Auriculariales sp. MPI-PUGE-AT-0066]
MSAAPVPATPQVQTIGHPHSSLGIAARHRLPPAAFIITTPQGDSEKDPGSRMYAMGSTGYIREVHAKDLASPVPSLFNSPAMGTQGSHLGNPTLAPPSMPVPHPHAVASPLGLQIPPSPQLSPSDRVGDRLSAFSNTSSVPPMPHDLPPVPSRSVSAVDPDSAVALVLQRMSTSRTHHGRPEADALSTTSRPLSLAAAPARRGRNARAYGASYSTEDRMSTLDMEEALSFAFRRMSSHGLRPRRRMHMIWILAKARRVPLTLLPIQAASMQTRDERRFRDCHLQLPALLFISSEANAFADVIPGLHEEDEDEDGEVVFNGRSTRTPGADSTMAISSMQNGVIPSIDELPDSAYPFRRQASGTPSDGAGLGRRPSDAYDRATIASSGLLRDTVGSPASRWEFLSSPSPWPWGRKSTSPTAPRLEASPSPAIRLRVDSVASLGPLPSRYDPAAPQVPLRLRPVSPSLESRPSASMEDILVAGLSKPADASGGLEESEKLQRPSMASEGQVSSGDSVERHPHSLEDLDGYRDLFYVLVTIQAGDVTPPGHAIDYDDDSDLPIRLRSVSHSIAVTTPQDEDIRSAHPSLSADILDGATAAAIAR